MGQKAQIGVCLPKELLEKLRYIATREHRSMSGLVRVLIRRHIQKFEEENGKIVIS